MTGSVLFKKEVNSDGILNLFTANHSSRQSFMLADGKTMFGPNKLEKWGLSQDELFLNQGDVFGRVSAPELGFEKRDCAARQVGLVDVDSDGLLDLHAPPNGVYRQHPDHQFTLEWELAAATTSLRGARAAWFDADNDGFRDVIVALQDPEKQWGVSFYRSLGNANHWLEVNLVGLPGNRQALGATITVATPAGVQTAGVGWAEGSHYGQGHYRLYFGLGPYDEVDSLTITWPDGIRQTLKSVAADQILTLSRRP